MVCIFIVSAVLEIQFCRAPDGKAARGMTCASLPRTDDATWPRVGDVSTRATANSYCRRHVLGTCRPKSQHVATCAAARATPCVGYRCGNQCRAELGGRSRDLPAAGCDARRPVSHSVCVCMGVWEGRSAVCVGDEPRPTVRSPPAARRRRPGREGTIDSAVRR